MNFKLKSIREDVGMTQSELSRRSGVTRMTINEIESNRKKAITTDTLMKLSEALGRNPSDFFDQ